MKRRLAIMGIAGLALIASAGAFAYEMRYPATRWIAAADRGLFVLPPARHPYDLLDAFLRSATEEIQANVSKAGGMQSSMTKHLPGLKIEAINTNNFGEVADSTWFTNRIGRYGPKPCEVAKLMSGCTLDSAGPLVVREASTGSNAPVLLVEDRAGARFIFISDAADAPGKMSSPAAAASLILSAAGYNAALHCPAAIDRGALSIADDSKLMGEYGKTGPLTADELTKLLEKQPQQMRGVAIRIPDGRPIGRFSFSKRPYGDKNDLMRHQDRRELRGLRIFSAFIGWVSISERTPYDTFVEAAGNAGYVEHWLLNLTEIAEPSQPFNPLGAGASGGNPAFALMTPYDAFWAARIVSLFSDQMIDAIVAAANYPDAGEAQKAVGGLKLRRDALAKKWFGAMSPLDDFIISSADGAMKVSCSDLVVIAQASDRRYRAELTTPYGRAIVVPWQEGSSCDFNLGDGAMKALADDGRVHELIVQAKDADDRWWLPPVKLFVEAKDGVPTIVGLGRRMH